jgi:nucleoid-associated protein YgaU
VSLLSRRSLVVSTALLGFMLEPVAMAQQAGPPNYLPIVLEAQGPATAVVEKGDHLWGISASHLGEQLTRVPNPAEVTAYWREVVEVNRDRLRSGHPDLIFPGETVVLPESG